MPRKANIDAPGGLHPLIIRGIERERISLRCFGQTPFLGPLGQHPVKIRPLLTNKQISDVLLNKVVGVIG
jgi:hypothetical protein